MVAAGNKAKRLSPVNHSIKAKAIQTEKNFRSFVLYLSVKMLLLVIFFAILKIVFSSRMFSLKS